jgi:uncharacterized membrane-anchored protein
MKTITAYYRASQTFEIPDTVFLLSQEENEQAEEGTYGMWWIKWGVLHYIDEDGNEHEIRATHDYEIDSKYPDTIDL